MVAPIGNSNSGPHSMAISEFKNNFDGGTRPNRFVVSGDLGSRGSLPNNFMVKAASMPAQTLGIIPLPFRGRIAKVPGDRAYAEWTITVLDETTYNMRRIFEAWHEEFNWHKENVVANKDILSGVGAEFTRWTVTQIDMFGTELRHIQLHNCWPVEVGAIDLSYDTADTLTEYSVTLAYDYITLGDGSGVAAGNRQATRTNSRSSSFRDGGSGESAIVRD